MLLDARVSGTKATKVAMSTLKKLQKAMELTNISAGLEKEELLMQEYQVILLMKREWF